MKTTVWCTVAVLLVMPVGIGGAAAAIASNSQAGREGAARGQTTIAVEVKPLVTAPGEAGEWEAWREGLRAQRQRMRERLHYDDGAYRNPAFAWVPSCYCCCFAMMCDQNLYDPVKRRYTIDAFLDEGVRDFGGYDAVVLWQAYPRIGFDERNQFDFYRDMPGGLAGLRELGAIMHRRGVKVFIDYNPWDTGTRREGKSDVEMLVEMVTAIDADGIFLDTLHEGMQELRGRLDAVRPGVVLESELTLPVERIGDHHMSRAQWFTDSEAPGVLWNKWFERRHMMHQIQRWNADHTSELHMAWMNGSGMLVWENVFGSWVGWSRRDRSILCSMLPIQRRYVSLFSGERWMPLVPTEHASVYASLWQGDGIRLWTFVNRSAQRIDGAVLRAPHVEGQRYYDLVTGRELDVEAGVDALLSCRLEPRGIAAYVAGTSEALGDDFQRFLAAQAAICRGADWDASPRNLDEKLRPVERTRKYARDQIPADMVAIPAAHLRMKVRYRNRECGFYQVEGQQAAAHPSRELHKIVGFEREVSLSAYAIDLTPVTNGQYARFLQQTGYTPRDGRIPLCRRSCRRAAEKSMTWRRGTLAVSCRTITSL